MDPKLKKILRGISLEIRRLLEGRHDERGEWIAGDLEERLKGMGVWRDREPKPVEELPHLSPEDKAARRLVDGYLKLREEAGVGRAEAVAEFVRESAYTWANRLFALRCMEARGIIDEVVLQKDAYGGRSMVHNRFAKRDAQACIGEDDGLFAVLFEEFGRRAAELPGLFDPGSPAVALRPSVAALKRTVALLSGREAARGQDAATDEVFSASDAFGWAYQYWNADEKDRVFEMVRTKKGTKIQGADIIPATQLYTEPYMVKFLLQNSLGALWMGMYPDSKLCESWEYYVKDADRASVTRKAVREVTFLDPAQGSGHFHLEAFDLFYAMYAEEAVREGRTLAPREICATILNQNLYGIDIDGRSVQIATAALWMKAKERALDLGSNDLADFHEHLVATNIRLPKERNHLELFLQKHPEDEQLRPALELVFQGLEHADQLGSLLQIEELVDALLRRLKEEADKSKGTRVQTGLFEPTLVQGTLPVSVEDYDRWKRDALSRLQTHFETEAQVADTVQAFFGESASKGLIFFNLLARRYDVVTANPPYMGSKNMGDEVKAYVQRHFVPGKRDLYAAFILRCVALARPAGRVAMVTQQSWMFLRSFAELRAVDAEKLTRLRDNDFKGLLRETTLETLVHLGEHAFEDSSAAGAFAAVFTLAVTIPNENHRLSAFRITGPKSPDEKIELLRQSLSWSPSLKLSNQRCHPVFSEPRQIRFLDITQSPLSYWLPEVFLEMMHSVAPLGSVCYVRQGICTTDNSRFVRATWESGAMGVKNRWVLFAKGGGAKRWSGFDQSMVDWEFDGIRIKSYQEDTPGAIHWKGRMPDPSYFFACTGIIW